jgi:D-tagatose-1,6-bisphosphate aldolase subunit GatZ/KbaZ
VRYYWTAPKVKDAVERLIANLGGVEIPETMLSAYLPEEYKAVRAGVLKAEAEALVRYHIRMAIAPYAAACAD